MYDYDRRRDVIDPKKLLPAVKKALETLSGLNWTFKGPYGPYFKRNHDVYGAKFYARETGKTTVVEWFGEGRWANVNFSGKWGLTLQGSTTKGPEQFYDARFFVKSLKGAEKYEIWTKLDAK